MPQNAEEMENKKAEKIESIWKLQNNIMQKK